MKTIAMLPSLLTLGNFTCGVISILFCLQNLQTHRPEMLTYACAAVFIAMIFDMLDGRVARMTGAESHFGAELDSLADDCTFGVAPAVLVTTLWIQVQPPEVKWWGQVMFCAVAYAACAILRLARYNVEVGKVEKNYFTGLPSPAAAGAVVSAVLICHECEIELANSWQRLLDCVSGVVSIHNTHGPLQMQARVLGIYMLFIGLLMVTRLRFVHVANRFLAGQKRFTNLVAMVFAVFFFLMYPSQFLFLTFNGYVLISLGYNAPRMAVTIRRWFTPKVEALRARRAARQKARGEQERDKKDQGAGGNG